MSDDRALRDRLSNLAAAVPVPPSSPTELIRTPVTLGPALRAPVSRSWLPVALVAVLVVAAVGILTSGSQPAYGPVVETVRQGDFELTLRADKGRYAPREPINIAASLTYRGSEAEVQVVHGGGTGRTPVVFVIREPVFGATLDGVWEASRNRTSLTRDVALDVPFGKSGGWLSPPPEPFQDWLAEPGLWLPSGTWHIAAIADFSVDDVEAFELEAEIAITVEAASPSATVPPSPSEFANPPLSNTVRDGDFELTIRSSKTRYTTDEAVDVSASLVYRGAEAAVDVWGGLTPIYSRETRDGVSVGFAVIAVCAQSRHERDVPHNVTIRTSRETAGRLDIEPVPLLPPGTWHLYVVAQTCAPGSEPDAIEFDLEAEITIEVVATEPVPTEATNPRESATDRDGDFELTLRSDKTRYAPNEQIDLVTTLTYVGAGESATFWHDSAGALDVGVREPIHGIDLMHVSLLTCDQTTIQRDNPLSVRGLAGVVFVPDDPAAEWVRGFLDSPLRLPIGVWHVYASAQTACMDHGPRSDLSAEITIVVEGDAPIVEWQQIPLMTADRPNLSGGCRMAHGGGRLAPNETSGIGVGSGDGSSAPVRWPFGYTGWEDEDDVVLVDADGRVVGRTGDMVEFAGGFGVDGIFGACWG